MANVILFVQKFRGFALFSNKSFSYALKHEGFPVREHSEKKSITKAIGCWIRLLISHSK